MDTFWKKKAFASVNAPINRAKAIIEDFLFDLDLESLLSNTASDVNQISLSFLTLSRYMFG